MTLCLGMWLKRLSKSLNRLLVCSLITLLLFGNSSGCWPFHSALAPDQQGTWIGEISAIEVIDSEHDFRHAVQIRITTPMIESRSGTVQETDELYFFPSDRYPIYAILVDRNNIALDGSKSSLLGKVIRVRGTMGYAAPPIHPKSLKQFVEKSSAGVVERTDGSREFFYSSGAVLLIKYDLITVHKK